MEGCAGLRVYNVGLGHRQEQEDVLQQMKATACYRLHHEQFQMLLDKKVSDLQAWVRKKWWASGLEFNSPAYKNFFNLVVKPSLRLDPNACNPQMTAIASEFVGMVSSGRLSEVDAVLAKIGHAACSGLLASHPVLLGIVTSSIDLLQRRSPAEIQRKDYMQIDASCVQQYASF